MIVGKYVRWADDFFVIFPNMPKRDDVRFPSHLTVAACHPAKPISAGFITFDGTEVLCQGKSETLGLETISDDVEFFEKELLQ